MYSQLRGVGCLLALCARLARNVAWVQHQITPLSLQLCPADLGHLVHHIVLYDRPPIVWHLVAQALRVCEPVLGCTPLVGCDTSPVEDHVVGQLDLGHELAVGLTLKHLHTIATTQTHTHKTSATARVDSMVNCAFIVFVCARLCVCVCGYVLACVCVCVCVCHSLSCVLTSK